MPTLISRNISYLRRKSEYTLKSLGERIGKTNSAIRSYESDVSSPPLPVAEQLAEIFNVPLAALITVDLTDPDNLAAVRSGSWSATDYDERGQLLREKRLLHQALTEAEQKLDRSRQAVKAMRAALEAVPPGSPAYERAQAALKSLDEG